jgi:hypothetical protein
LPYRSLPTSFKSHSGARIRSTRKSSRTREVPRSKSCSHATGWTTLCKILSMSRKRGMSVLLVCRIVSKIKKRPFRKELIELRNNRKSLKQLLTRTEIRARSEPELTSRSKNFGVSS